MMVSILPRRFRDVDDPDLRPLPTAEAVHRQGPDKMHRRALEPHEGLAKLLSRSSERDALDRPSVAADRAQAQMTSLDPDRHHLRRAMARQGEQGPRRARAIGAGRLEPMDELRRRR